MTPDFFYFFDRSYITFDILRRVLTDYFNYDVMYVMNITDVDDKIIKRARQNWLYERYAAQTSRRAETLIADAAHVLEQLTRKIKANADPDKATLYERTLNR